MPNFKLVIADPKSRKAYQKEVDQGKSGLMGKVIGEKFKGDGLGLTGYQLQITGGSDRDGFPMRGDVKGTTRKKVLLAFGPGFHPRVKGQRKRKSVRGNTISSAITQINVKVDGHGPKPLESLLGKEEKKQEPKEEKAEKREEKKEEAAPKEKPEKAEKEEKPKDTQEESVRAEEKMGVKELEKAEKEKK